MAITALIMTAAREEVIDFVAPYFEQTGITIGKEQISTFQGDLYKRRLGLNKFHCYALDNQISRTRTTNLPLT